MALILDTGMTIDSWKQETECARALLMSFLMGIMYKKWYNRDIKEIRLHYAMDIK